MELPMTFADFAVTEARFRKQFRTAPRDAWNENMVPLVEYLDLSAEDREGKYPFIWAVDKKNRLIRVIPADPIVKATEDRRNFWRMLKSLAGIRETVDAGKIAEQAKAEFAQTIAAQLLQIAKDGNILTDTLPGVGVAVAPSPITTVPVPGAPAPDAHASTNGYVAPWIDSSQCTSCDECTTINSKIFAYDGNKHAYVKDPKGGPYKDLVRAAEKCTAQVIHPGTPFDPKEKDVDKLLKRAAKYN
jgi:pyruvate-ferredoxin/flavodoxin oxidoreductase